jgi:hypothetical protein
MLDRLGVELRRPPAAGTASDMPVKAVTARRRGTIEPAIGQMKTDGKLDRNWLEGALGDAMHAVLCSAGHDIGWRRRHGDGLRAESGTQRRREDEEGHDVGPHPAEKPASGFLIGPRPNSRVRRA